MLRKTISLEAHLIGAPREMIPGSPDPTNTDTRGIPYEYIYVFTHTRTHSTLNREREVKTGRTGSSQMALAWAGRRDKGSICPGSGSHWWPPSRRRILELEEQEVLILLEESFKVQ